ncbi:MAG TPA: cysteine synthase family protein [Vicinamibacterales bacterium]|nr:cysteine synthase family protein [Vicinamibacterales bacterium]
MSSLRVSESILDLVGRTPLLRLKQVEPSGGAQIWAKLEYLNPGGSVKDRAALGMVLAAERDGRLTRESVIIEPTAGNTGIGLALIGSQRGYRVVLVVPDNFSREKLLVMRALGGELVLTPEDDGIRGAIAKARELAETIPHAVVLQQFENQSNPAYHHDVTGPEIWEQMDGRVDAIVIGAGTGGTFTGVVRYFRERGSRALAVLVEPQGSIWSGAQRGPHRVEGIGGSFWPGTLDRSLIDEIVTVPDDPAFETTRALARECGVLSGGSGGAAVYGAIQIARRLGAGARVATVIPDGAERYISKGVFDED